MSTRLARTIIAVFFSALVNPLSASPKPDDLQASYLTVGVQLISDSFSGRLSSTSSEALSINGQWKNRTPFEWLTEDKNYYSIDLMLNSEAEAERYDTDRDSLSAEFSASFQRPFKQLASGALISVVAGLEYLENAQQTEEFEYTIYTGLAFDSRFTWLNNSSSWGAVAAFACNEEEKDDDIPHLLFELDRNELNRKGCGFYTHLYTTMFITPSLSWSISADNYTGDYGEKHYRRQRFLTRIRLFFGNNNSCDANYRLIRRNSEREFLGMGDEFYQLGIGCSHRF